MAVSNVVSAVTRIGDGIAVAFAFDIEAVSAASIKVGYIVGITVVEAAPATYSVVMNGALTGGTVTFLVPPAAATKIYIYRVTDQTQVVSVSRQQAYNPSVVERVWDKLTLLIQELSTEVRRSVKAVPGVNPDLLVNELETARQQAVASAAAAVASAAAAAASAAEALAKENSMLRDRGAWATLTLYSPSDIFTSNGTSYITQTAHIASSIAVDQAANRIRVFAAKGDAGPGSGDMLKTENLSGLTNVPQARTNLGLQALATKAQAAFADIDPTAVITDVEGLFANKVANAVPVAKAVTDICNAVLVVADEKTSGTAGGTFSSGAWRTRDLTAVRHNGITGSSLTANQITLPAGVYLVEADAPALRVNGHQARLQNITDGVTLVSGSSEITEQSGAIVSSRSRIQGVITLASTKILEIQHICQTGFAGSGFGPSVGAGVEVYTAGKFQRIG